MTDTVKIKRPLVSRRQNDTGGRIKHDSRGNAKLVRTRADDERSLPDVSALAIVEDEPAKPVPALKPYERG
jgi:hypothetical protein